MSDIIKPLGQNKIWASNGVAVEPSDAKYQTGWVVERPPYQWVNFYLRKFSTTLAAINQKGFPTWDAETEYRANLSWSLGSNGAAYFCKVTHTNQNPVTDVSESYWRKVLDGGKVLSASSVSNYMLTVLDEPDSSSALTALGLSTIGKNVATSTTSAQALQSLGGTTTGINIFTANSAGWARSYLGGTVVGQALFVAPSQMYARAAIGMSPFGSDFSTSGDAATGRAKLGLGQANESTQGLVVKASDAEAIAGAEDTKYLTPRKLRLGFSFSANHIKFPSWLLGIEIRYGRDFISGNTSITKTNLFTNAAFVAVGNFITSSDTDQRALKIDVSGRSVLLRNADSTSSTAIWLAIGH